jgi:AbrB family looped-hinge helix DNA binding protein
MRVTVDSAGRLVLPKKLRSRLALGRGGVVEVSERDGVIEIVPVPADVEVTEGDGGPVAHRRDEVPPLTDDDVRSAVDHLRS